MPLTQIRSRCAQGRTAPARANCGPFRSLRRRLSLLSQDIAKRNAQAALDAKSPEALAAKEAKEKDEEGGAVIASAAITIFLAASTAVSMAPVSENVKRVGQKVKTGKGRKY